MSKLIEYVIQVRNVSPDRSGLAGPAGTVYWWGGENASPFLGVDAVRKALTTDRAQAKRLPYPPGIVAEYLRGPGRRVRVVKQQALLFTPPKRLPRNHREG